MGKAPAFQFYIKDWLSDTQLRLASPSTRGIWIDLLCFMWQAPARGTITTTWHRLAKMVGAENGDLERFVSEATELSFCDIVTDRNKNITVCNRRMLREEKAKESNRLRQQKHRSKRKGNKKVTAYSPSAIASAGIYKRNFGEFSHVKLTEVEFDKLEQKYGKSIANLYIEKVDVYIEQTEKKYKSHYATILSWAKKDKIKSLGESASSGYVLCPHCGIAASNIERNKKCPFCDRMIK